MTFLLELRNAAKACSKPEYAAQLRQCADSVAFCIKQLAADPTTERMIELNCAWAHASAALKAVPPEGDPAPVSGSPEPAKLAMAA